MAASLATFASILKEYYLGPIQDQLNEETLVCDMFEKASVDWNGRQVIIPVHVARNANVGFRGEGAALPGPAIGVVGGLPAGAPGAGGSQQGYANLTVTAHNLYGRFQISGPAMAAAGKGGANSFVGWVDGEMQRLVNDVKNACNRAAVSGGLCLGFANHNAQIAAAAATNVLFTGDQAKAAAMVAGAVTGDIDLVRTDTYASVLAGGGTALISGTTPAAGTIQLTIAVGTADFNLAVDPTGTSVPVAVVLTNQGAATLAGVAGFSDPRQEPVGIYGNLGLANHWGVDRTTATGTANALQCGDGAAVPTPNMTMTIGANGAARTALTLASIQQVLDRITVASDEETDVILCHPLQRTRLAALLQGNINFNTDKSGGGNNIGDGGFKGFAFAGIPVKTSRHVDNGGLWFVSAKSWKMTELEAGKFADEDGDVLSRIGVADAYEGFYKWYYNVTCVRPNANGALLQLTL